MIKYLLILILTTLSFNSLAQKERKVTFIGGARSTMNNNQISVTDTLLVDTTTAKRNTGGYALIDLGVNIKPNKNTEILGMFRIRNGFGGFWGSAVTMDVRQLYLKGVVANVLRYQLGDLNLKQTPFTLYNHHADAIDSLPTIFNMQRNIINYERFYGNNAWRMQGANVDFGVSFKEFIKEINVTAFTTRLNATNFGNVPDRLMSGAVLELVQSNNFKIAYNVNAVYDVLGTIRDTNIFKNTIHTLDATYKKNIGKQKLKLSGEIGKSNYNYSADTLAPKLNDYFMHANASMEFAKQNVKATIGYLNVGPQYRSIGAQSKDVNYNAVSNVFERYTNAQNIRPLGLIDVLTNENVYSTSINSKLMPENVLFNNILPYGIATFNRLGAYATVRYKKDIDANISYYNLREIQGQGTLALRKFSIIKMNAMVPMHTYLKLKNKLEVQFGAALQNTARTSSEALENMNLKNTQATAGLRWELFKDFDLLAGYVLQNTKGNNFTADRNSFTEVTYFTQQQYDVQQNMKAAGVRYNFTPKIFLSALYQQSLYANTLKQNADFKINQFGIIYNMLF